MSIDKPVRGAAASVLDATAPLRRFARRSFPNEVDLLKAFLKIRKILCFPWTIFEEKLLTFHP